MTEITSQESHSESFLDNINAEYMLEFETQIFLDILHKDGLVVAAKGLNLQQVITNLLTVYADPGNLVIVLNASEEEEKYYSKNITDGNIHCTTCSTSTNDRMDTYLSGGIHFVTTRILVVDMLKQRIPTERITGFFILRAHKVLESCQEAFVLRLYRQNNKTGFIKAFSNSVQSFTMGFGHVERVMRTIFVKELYIWPRFQSTVIECLKKYEPSVIELLVPLPEKLQTIQTCILDLIDLTVKELKRLNRTVELQEISVENCLTKQFQKILQLQLNPIWHQLNTKSMQLVADLKNLRHLLITMLHSDSIALFQLISTYRTVDYALNATWVITEPAETLFSTVKSLVFDANGELNPEFCPKWTTLLEILKVEIPHEQHEESNNKSDQKIVILCSDRKTCYQLKELLMHGPCHYLFLMVLKSGINFKKINEKFLGHENINENTQKSSTSEDETECEENEDFKSSYVLTMSQVSKDCNATISECNDQNTDLIFEPFPEMENLNLTEICEKSVLLPTIFIQTFKGDGYINLQANLEDIKPTHIIMYQSNITAIREIEMYEAHRQRNTNLKVFFLIHSNTVEEQAYLTSLRREKEAFEFLIDTKATMVVPEDQDGKSDICSALQRGETVPKIDTRKGGAEITLDLQKNRKFIIVDMREFRSELPALIYKRGIDIEPVTIAVGDYILTPDICVERKSLSDLVGSLNSGRLYQQCTQMFRFYAKPILLIEFDQNKSFSWQHSLMISQDKMSSFDVQQKLLLLTIHFPKLKIFWSPSPYASAQLFDELKETKPEPNIEYAAALGGDQDLDTIESKYNSCIYDFIQKLPGITSKNIDTFLRNFNSLDDVIKQSENSLKTIVNNDVDVKALYGALNTDHNPKTNTDKNVYKGKGKNRFKYTRKT